MTTPILGITEISGNQQNQYITANEAFRALEASANDFLSVDLSAGDVTLTQAQFAAAYTFVGSGHAVARVLTVPASKRAFTVRNAGTANLDVKVGAATVSIAASAAALLLTDGTADGLYSVVAGTGGGGGGTATDLSYIASPANGVVVSSTGTDATIPLSTAVDAGLMSPAQNTKVAGLGTMSTQNANAVAVTGGTIIGPTKLWATPAANQILANYETESPINILNTALGNTRLLIGIDNTINRSYIQSMETSVAATTRPLCLQPQLGRVLIGTTTDNGLDRLQVNGSIKATGTISGSLGVLFTPYLKTTVPSAAANPNTWIVVSDAATGRRLFGSDGVNWRDALNTILS